MTDSISSQLIIEMGGRSISEQISSSQLHIEDDGSVLNIYVSDEENLRDVCYMSDLPKRLAEWIMTDPKTQIREDIKQDMVMAIQAILNSKFSVVERLLDDFGIIEAGTINRDPEEGVYDIASSALSSQVCSSSSSRHMGSFSPYSLLDGITLKLSIESSIERKRDAANEYRELLSQIIAVARRSRLLAGTFDLSGLEDSLTGYSIVHDKTFNEYDLFNAGSIFETERNEMVGAAGELFVSKATS